jgi:hypothetical protein
LFLLQVMCLVLFRLKGYQVVFVPLVWDTCVIQISLSLVPTPFISETYWFRNISLTCSGSKWNIILRNNSWLYNVPFLGILKIKNSFTCFCYKWCFKYSFGSMGIKLYLFHLFGIHVLSEFSFPLFPLLSSRGHIGSEISL